MNSTDEGNLMQSSIEAEAADLLTDLLAGQDEMLEILNRKTTMLGEVDQEGLANIAGDEERLLGTLQECLKRREELLARAGSEGLPSSSIQALAKALPPVQREPLSKQIAAAGAQSRLLQHQSLINWVLIQRTLIHLSQLLEIIATGGRIQPTYGKAELACAHGAMVDQEA
jgi:hypothetical protein